MWEAPKKAILVHFHSERHTDYVKQPQLATLIFVLVARLNFSVIRFEPLIYSFMSEKNFFPITLKIFRVKNKKRWK